MRLRVAMATPLVMLITLGASSGQTSGTKVVGVIASVERHSPTTLQVAVRTLGGRNDAHASQTIGIQTDERTAYLKWVTHQPWQQDARANSASLAPGQCVEVKLRSGDVADVFRVNTDPAGTMYDPCKGAR